MHGQRQFCGASHVVGKRAVVWPDHIAQAAVPPFAAGLSLGLSAFALARIGRRLRRYLRRHLGQRRPFDASDESLGHALVQAAARGPEGLDVKARAAYDLIRGAAEAGVKEFSSSCDLRFSRFALTHKASH